MTYILLYLLSGDNEDDDLVMMDDQDVMETDADKPGVGIKRKAEEAEESNGEKPPKKARIENSNKTVVGDEDDIVVL